MLGIYYLLYFYTAYFSFFLPEDFEFTLFSRKGHHSSRVQGYNDDYIVERLSILRHINRIVSDLAFFRWLDEHLKYFKNYRKSVIENPHIDVRITDHNYEEYTIYKQVNKKKFSKVI